MAVPDTLRGFRTQFLYTVYRIISDNNPKLIYKPEGIEDLDIYSDNIVTETIQVKNKKDCLSLSDLSSPTKQTSFFIRAYETYKSNSEAKFVVVSFGDIGISLTDKNRLSKSLKRDTTIKDVADRIVSQFNCIKVDEDTLYNQIVSKLKTSNPLFNPDAEIRYLLQWIFEIAEKGDSISVSNLFNQLNAFREFENRNGISVNQLGIRIKSIFSDPVSKNINLSGLKAEFESGVSVRPTHIEYNLDYRREWILTFLSKLFVTSNVVIVHGISGQGKSALCYRYIKDNYPVAFEVKSYTRNHLAEINATIKELSAGLQIPIIIYFDVQPGEKDWINIISEYTQYENLRFLISIREEDWNISKPLLNTFGQYSELHLTLSMSEARQIYSNLCPTGKYDFDNVWEALEEDVPLLEFMYYLTHGKTLRDKISTQFSKLNTDTKKIVSYICIINYLGGKVTENELAELNEIDVFSLHSKIQDLIGEYFNITENGAFTDVHPIRTSLLKNLICGQDNHLLIKLGLKLLLHLNIEDGDTYIINLLKTGLTVDKLFETISSQPFISGILSYSIAKALIWKGATDYTDKHKKYFDELRVITKDAYELFIPVNFTELDVISALQGLKNIQFPWDEINDVRNKIQNQTNIFIPLKHWLNNSSLQIKPYNSKDWVYIGQLLYLTGFANLTNRINIVDGAFIKPNELSALELADVLLGLKTAQLLECNWNEIEQIFIHKLRFEHLLFQFDIDETSVSSITSLSLFDGHHSHQALSRNNVVTNINQRLVDICTSCRKAFPDKAMFRVSIENGILTNLFVDTEKQISKQNLPLPIMHSFRNIVCHRYKEHSLNENKKSLSNKILDLRNQYLNCCVMLLRGLSDYISKKQIKPSLCQEIDKALEQLKGYPFISPIKNIFDQNGNNALNYNDRIARIYTNASKLLESISNYKIALDNFFNQFTSAIANSSFNVSKSNLFEALRLTSIISHLHYNLVNDDEKTKIEKFNKQESDIIQQLWIVWEYISRCNIQGTTLKHLKCRYSKMNVSLPTNLCNYLQQDFESLGYNAIVKQMGNTIKVTATYSSIDRFRLLHEALERSLSNYTNKYDWFSTQKYILESNVDEIQLDGIFISPSGRRYNLSGSTICISMNNAFLLNGASIPSVLFEYKKCSDILLSNHLNHIITFGSIIQTMIIMSSQIMALSYKVDKNDSIGMKLFSEFKQSYYAMNAKIKDTIRAINDVVVSFPKNEEMNKLQSLTDRFSKFIELDWLMEFDIVESFSKEFEELSLDIKYLLCK